MPNASRRSRPVVAVLITAAALVAGVSHPGAANASAPASANTAPMNALTAPSPTGTGFIPGFIMGDGQTPCDPIRHRGC